MVTNKNPSEWGQNDLSLLKELQPLIESVLGVNEFPPSKKTVEKFIDTLSMYGFHCFLSEKWDEIDSSGLLQHFATPTYFIADRRISDNRFYEEPIRSFTIDASEYFSRFGQSIEFGFVRSNVQWGDGDILVLNRKKGLDEIVRNGAGQEIKELRGAGFLGDGILYRTPLLDEGYLEQGVDNIYIPRNAIVGLIPTHLGRDITNFYEVTTEDFLKNK